MTAENLAELFGKLTQERPQMAEWFSQKRDELTGELEMWGAVAEPKPLTETERQATQKAAQAYCDRIASVIRGIAHIAAFDFPELSERFYRSADDAARILEDYKTALTLRADTTPSPVEDMLRPMRPPIVKGTDDTVPLADVVPTRIPRFRRSVAEALIENEKAEQMQKAMSSE